MRIVLSCLQSEITHPVPAYRYWERYFVGGIVEGGHQWSPVTGVDWGEGLLYGEDPARAAAWRSRVWGQTIDFLRRADGAARPDIFLSYLYPWMVDAAAIGEIRSLGISCVNYFCDNVREFVAAPEEYRPFDLHWVPELAATAFYARARMPFIHAAMPAWIPPEQRRWDHAERYGVLFIGSRDRLRERLLYEAISLGAPIELRGPGWPLPGVEPSTVASAGRSNRHIATVAGNQVRFIRKYGAAAWLRKVAEPPLPAIDDALLAPHVAPALDPAGYLEKTQGARIVVGVNRYPSFRRPASRPDTYSRSRDVEAPMMGACYLTEWTPELDEMYDVGSEIETFRDAGELAAKIAELEADPARRRAMRRAGQQRALTEHSVPRTLERIAERLGIRAGVQ